MKKSFLTFAMIALFSTNVFAGKLGRFIVKSCTIAVPKGVSDDVVRDLMKKGFNPAVPIDADSFRVDIDADAAHVKATNLLHNDLFFQGSPYLEIIDKDFSQGETKTTLSVGIVGQIQIAYSGKSIPNCVED